MQQEDETSTGDSDDLVRGPRPVFMTGRPVAALDSSESSESAEEEQEDPYETLVDGSANVFEFLIDVFKYVDDTTLVEAVDISQGTRHFSTGMPQSTSRARYSERLAGAVKARAEEVGMKVNCSKTQLLLIAPQNGYNDKAVIRLGNEAVESASELKLLGFMFGSQPNVNRHIDYIKKKYRQRFWAIIHLKNNGFVGAELMSLFNIFVRPVIEYCSLIYHPLLTLAQSETLERMQKQAVKLAYGWDQSYETICDNKGIETLKKRREKYIDRFVSKTLLNSRFSNTWFPVRDPAAMNIRGRRNYIETRARTSRYYNSPLSYMRRRANDLLTGVMD